jgi:hypothetical protein
MSTALHAVRAAIHCTGEFLRRPYGTPAVTASEIAAGTPSRACAEPPVIRAVRGLESVHLTTLIDRILWYTVAYRCELTGEVRLVLRNSRVGRGRSRLLLPPPTN